MRRYTALILFFLVFIVGVALAPSIGPAWDEPDNMFSAGVYVNFFRHGMDPQYFSILTDKASVFGDRIIPNDHLISHLPPIHNYVGLLIIYLQQLLGFLPTAVHIITAYHIATAFFFAILTATVYRFAILLGLSPPVGIFVALTTWLYPTLFGHGYSNSKDTAQAALVTLSLYYLVRGRKNDLLYGAMVWGLALATKFNAVYVPIIWGMWSLLYDRKNVRTYVTVFLIGIATLIIVWPYLWFDPVGHLKEMVMYFMNVGKGYFITWNGQRYAVGVGISYWWYPILSFIYMTPLELLAIVILGAFQVRLKPIRMILPVWIAVPLFRTFWPWSNYYDYLRHFLEILPALMLVAALGLGRLGKWGIAVGGIVIAHLLIINIVYFPYSTGYFNLLAKNPNQNFDRDIEALSIKEGMDYVHAKYPSARIFAPIGLHLVWYYLKPNNTSVYREQDADVIILPNKMSNVRQSTYVVSLGDAFVEDHVISRGSAIFGWVYRRKIIAR